MSTHVFFSFVDFVFLQLQLSSKLQDLIVYVFFHHQTRRRSESTSSSSSSNVSHGDLEQGRSSLPQLQPDTNLQKGAPPSYSDAVQFIATVPEMKSNPPQYTASGQEAGEPESSLPSYPGSGATLPYPSTYNADLPYPSTTSTEVPYPPVSNPTAPYPPASNAGVQHTRSNDLEVPYPPIGLPGNTNVAYYPLTLFV